MIVVMKENATELDIKNIIKLVESLGLETHISKGLETTIIGIIGDTNKFIDKNPEILSGVEKIVKLSETYKLANKKFKQEKTIIDVRGIKIGGDDFVLMAGPCAVESREQLMASAIAAKNGGAQMLRGGAFKPRTSPYSFQGLEKEGLAFMKEVSLETGMPVVSEVTSNKAIAEAVDYVDILQIGARNMQNFELLKEAGKTSTPILLKRGLSATIDEWLNAAEYIMAEGNKNVILCERGIRTYETATRNTLDISAIPVIKKKSHLPIIVDPSHATGIRSFVEPLSKASIAVGADGLMIEVHPTPETALSDGAQSLNPEDFKQVCENLRPFVSLMGRKF